MRDEIAEAVDRLLSEQCPPKTVGKIDDGQSAETLWHLIEEAAFLDAAVAEQHGGSGLGLDDVGEMIRISGAHALPLPLGETVIIRGLVSSQGLQPSKGGIAIAGVLRRDDDFLHCDAAIGGMHAQWFLAGCGGEAKLLRAGTQSGSSLSSLAIAMRWSAHDWRQYPTLCTQSDLTSLHALIRALQLCGAMSAVLDRSIAYANEREQFGRPISKFQAIQHDLAVMAEHVYAASMAAEQATKQNGLRFDRLKIAVAKARSSEAAVEVAALAHSVHGAIGFSREYPLQLWTRRLHIWRQAAGSEAYWHDVLGTALFDDNNTLCLDLLRSLTDCAA